MGHQLTDDRSRISVAFGETLGRQVPRFLIFSGLSTVVALVTGYLLYQVLGFGQAWRYGVSVGVSALVGMVVSFVLNRRYTFARSGRPLGDEMRTFLIVALGGLALTVGLSTLFRDWLLPWLTGLLVPEAWRDALNLELIAHVGAVGLVAFYSFLGHKYLSFGLGIRGGLKLDGRATRGHRTQRPMESRWHCVWHD